MGGNGAEARDLCLIGLTQLDEKSYGELTPVWPVLGIKREIIEQRMFTDGEFFTESGKAQFIAVERQTHCRHQPWIPTYHEHRSNPRPMAHHGPRLGLAAGFRWAHPRTVCRHTQIWLQSLA